MASNGSCFMVIRTILQSHLLDIGRTQNHETMALWTLTTVDLICFEKCEDLHEYEFILTSFVWGPDHIWLHNTLEGSWPHVHCMVLEVTKDGLWTRSFGLSQFHGHGSWLVCEVALSASNNFKTNLYDNHYKLNSQHNLNGRGGGGERLISPLNKHESLPFYKE